MFCLHRVFDRKPSKNNIQFSSWDTHKAHKFNCFFFSENYTINGLQKAWLSNMPKTINHCTLPH